MTLSERLNKESQSAFRRSLKQRQLNGEKLQAGESYIYLNGFNVEERKATQDDIDTVKAK